MLKNSKTVLILISLPLILLTLLSSLSSTKPNPQPLPQNRTKRDTFSGKVVIEYKNYKDETKSESFDKNATEINLSHTAIKSFTNPKIFEQFDRLEKLNLADNWYLTLPDLSELTNLKELWLSGLQLKSLPNDIFKNLTNLEFLTFHYNKLTSLPENIFKNLTNLTHLSLSSNNLTSLPDLSGLTELTHLYLDKNQLESLPNDIFKNLTNLTHLDLYGNKLTTLPDLSKLTKLDSLNLSKTNITDDYLKTYNWGSIPDSCWIISNTWSRTLGEWKEEWKPKLKSGFNYIHLAWIIPVPIIITVVLALIIKKSKKPINLK